MVGTRMISIRIKAYSTLVPWMWITILLINYSREKKHGLSSRENRMRSRATSRLL